MKVRICEVLEVLISCSEKGANIARIIRSESALLQLLVEEKTGDQKNERFVQDFKTLADVLVQEMVRYELSRKYPEIAARVHGEESNKFTNVLGEAVTVEIKENKGETISLLSTVLDGNEEAVELLSNVIHTDVSIDCGEECHQLQAEIDISDIGVWIDPIDSTAQYIQGQTGFMTGHGMVQKGLQCVAVLIGVYDLHTGLPIIGIANQPFWQIQPKTERWNGQITWGVCFGDIKAHSKMEEVKKESESKPILLMSTSEKKEIKESFGGAFNLQYAAGAGYKLLCVAQDLADAYLLSKDTVFKWDSCGLHAILRSLGGGLLTYSRVLDLARQGKDLGKSDLSSCEVLYNTPAEEGTQVSQFCNKGGMIAYHDFNVLKTVFRELEKF
ncbi:hypothetical protein ScPMuIL_015234 [Solemya velum]